LLLSLSTLGAVTYYQYGTVSILQV